MTRFLILKCFCLPNSMSGKKKGGKKKGGDGGFGAALVNSRMKHRKTPGEGNHGPTKYLVEDSYIGPEDRLRSMTDDYTLGDFVTDAELNGKTFTAMRGQVRIVDRAQLTKEAYLALHRTPEQIEAEERLKHRLRIPRRPYWDENTTADELHQAETKELIEWRRALSIIEEDGNVTLSPFEKNPEVWKELWHVLERSQVAVYIIDARDPLSFFCEDFILYMNELKLPILICINKGDLVPPPIRKEWARYFEELSHNLPFKFEFVSAKAPGDDLITPRQLILKAKALAAGPGRDGKVTIGFVGFPNVGKSSCLNSAVGRVCVRSSSTPGKTKHLQTINIEEEGITLCDCPGLVFPLFEQSRAAMLCNGVINIDHMTDHIGPAMIIAERLPAKAFNLLYGTQFKTETVDYEELLNGIAKVKGLTKGLGLPDDARAARFLLKDYCDGKLIHCELPPGTRLKSVEQPLTPEELKASQQKPAEETHKEEEEKPQEEEKPKEVELPNIDLPDLSSIPEKKEKKPMQYPNPKKRGVVRITSLE